MNICHSGGADGADLEFLIQANKSGHQVKIHSFPSHQPKGEGNHVEIIKHSDDDFNKIKSKMESLSKILSRPIPHSHPFVKKLLYRNYYQIHSSDSVYVVSEMDHSMPNTTVRIKGGSAWAPQAFVQKQSSPFFSGPISLFFYDQGKEKWFQCHLKSQYIEWIPISQPPKPCGSYTGIGTRDLNEKGKQAIQNLYKTKFDYSLLIILTCNAKKIVFHYFVKLKEILLIYKNFQKWVLN